MNDIAFVILPWQQESKTAPEYNWVNVDQYVKNYVYSSHQSRLLLDFFSNNNVHSSVISLLEQLLVSTAELVLSQQPKVIAVYLSNHNVVFNIWLTYFLKRISVDSKIMVGIPVDHSNFLRSQITNVAATGIINDVFVGSQPEFVAHSLEFHANL
jgi:hypothetical protein